MISLSRFFCHAFVKCFLSLFVSLSLFRWPVRTGDWSWMVTGHDRWQISLSKSSQQINGLILNIQNFNILYCFTSFIYVRFTLRKGTHLKITLLYDHGHLNLPFLLLCYLSPVTSSKILLRIKGAHFCKSVNILSTLTFFWDWKKAIFLRQPQIRF